MQLLAVLTMESSVSIKKRAEDMLGLTGLGSFNAVETWIACYHLQTKKDTLIGTLRQILNNVNSKSSLGFLLKWGPTIHTQMKLLLCLLLNSMPQSIPTVIRQSSHIPKPIARFRLCVKGTIYTLAAYLDRSTILTYRCWNWRTFPKYPSPCTSVWLIWSFCDVGICPIFSIIACDVYSNNISSSSLGFIWW